MPNRCKLPPWRLFLLWCSALLVLSSCGGGPPSEHWPAYTPSPTWQGMVKSAVDLYTKDQLTYKNNLQDYTTTGDWLNYGLTQSWSESNTVHFDSDGVPLVNYGGTFYYQPVTVSLYALSMYGEYLRGMIHTTDPFFKAVHRLLLMEDSNGAMRYPFTWKYYLAPKPYSPGWVSGMGQGLMLSVMARAYNLTKAQIYLDAGDRAFQFFATSVSLGGVVDDMTDLDPSLTRRFIFEEYVAHPSSFTLNGYMFTLLGIYDWAQVPGANSTSANQSFQWGIDTLHHILPYYDVGGFSAYDMSHLTYHQAPHLVAGYHAIHVYLLHALASVTGDAELTDFEHRWASYVPQ